MNGDGILVAKEEFDKTEPAEGDECVLMGNTTMAIAKTSYSYQPQKTDSPGLMSWMV